MKHVVRLLLLAGFLAVPATAQAHSSNIPLAMAIADSTNDLTSEAMTSGTIDPPVQGCKTVWFKHTGYNITGTVLFWIKDTTHWCYYTGKITDDSCTATAAAYYVWSWSNKSCNIIKWDTGVRRSRAVATFKECFQICVTTRTVDACLTFNRNGGWSPGNGC